MPRRFTDGPARITVDDDAVVRNLDKLANGAPSLVIRESKKELAPIMAAAVSRWPVRYKNSRNSRGSFRLFDVVEGSKLKVGIENTAKSDEGKGYAWFVRYSRRDRASLVRELSKVENIARDAQDYAQGIKTPGVYLFEFLSKARELAEAQSIELPPMERTRTARGIVRLYRDSLFRTHGLGAERRVLAGRSIWTSTVRNPGRKAALQVADKLQREIVDLARGE
jgi:hypothetical protein